MKDAESGASGHDNRVFLWKLWKYCVRLFALLGTHS